MSLCVPDLSPYYSTPSYFFITTFRCLYVAAMCCKVKYHSARKLPWSSWPNTFTLICYCLLSTTPRSTSLSKGSVAVLGWFIMLFYSISLCTQKSLMYLYNPTDLVCVRCYRRHFWNWCRGSFWAFGCVVFTLQATWSLFRQRLSVPFFVLFSLYFLFFPCLGETAVSDFGLPWGEFHRHPPTATFAPIQALSREKTMESLSFVAALGLQL